MHYSSHAGIEKLGIKDMLLLYPSLAVKFGKKLIILENCNRGDMIEQNSARLGRELYREISGQLCMLWMSSDNH